MGMLFHSCGMLDCNIVDVMELENPPPNVLLFGGLIEINTSVSGRNFYSVEIQRYDS